MVYVKISYRSICGISCHVCVRFSVCSYCLLLLRPLTFFIAHEPVVGQDTTSCLRFSLLDCLSGSSTKLSAEVLQVCILYAYIIVCIYVYLCICLYIYNMIWIIWYMIHNNCYIWFCEYICFHLTNEDNPIVHIILQYTRCTMVSVGCSPISWNHQQLLSAWEMQMPTWNLSSWRFPWPWGYPQ